MIGGSPLGLSITLRFINHTYIGSKGPELTGCWRETETQFFFMPRLQQEKEKQNLRVCDEDGT